MATIRQHLLTETTTAISELAKIINRATTHGEDEYTNYQFAEALKQIADDRLTGWIGSIIEEEATQ